MKVCSTCKINKSLSDFHKRRQRPSGVASSCKQCRKETERVRYLANRERIIERTHAYNDENRERINARQREYNSSCPEVNREYRVKNKDVINKRRRDKRNNDPLFNMQDRIRRRVNYAFTVMRFSKKSNTEDLLGASWDVVKNHIESKFVDGMSWANRGEWEIDHIVPYASAKTEDDVIRLSHYTNLQPLWRTDNRRKSSKF